MHQLFKQSKFLAYFSTQFLGALNDNFFKNALTLSIIFNVQQNTLQNSQQDSLLLINLAAALFILPFVVLSPLAGKIAQASEKSRYIQRLKLLEIVLMCAAAILFLFNQTYALLTLLFLMGCQSTLFGPVKYSILPLMLPKQDWYQANALVEAATFIAILAGLFLSSFLMQSTQASLYFAIGLVLFSLLGYLSAKRIPIIDRPHPNHKILSFNFFKTVKQQLTLVKQQKLTFVIMAISYFWFYGAIYLTQLPAYVKYHLSASSNVYSLLLILFAAGIGIGSLSSRRFVQSFSLKHISLFGLIGLIVFGMGLSFFSANTQSELLNLTPFITHLKYQLLSLTILAIGVSGGFFIVPLYTLLQLKSNDNNRSNIIAANNFINALLMIASAIFAIALLQIGFSIAQLFFILSLLSIGLLFVIKNI